jgi:hypothetical protein
MNTVKTIQTFTKIYAEKLWSAGKYNHEEFCSGEGSREVEIVVPYVKTIREFLEKFAEDNKRKPIVSDFGCGDFEVGSQLADLCEKYYALDIVDGLIEHNKKKFNLPNVNFLLHDFCASDLPSGDIAFVRQVFQHLSNDQISNAVEKIKNKFEYLIVTEHLPLTDFTPNLEVPAIGSGRWIVDSGVVLSLPPFTLNEGEIILEVDAQDDWGIIRTTLYKLK